MTRAAPRHLARAHRAHLTDRRCVAFLVARTCIAAERRHLKSLGADPRDRAAIFAGFYLGAALNPHAPPMAA